MTFRSSGVPTGVTFLIVEPALTMIVLALAFCCSNARCGVVSRVEAVLASIARRRSSSVLICGAMPCVVRLALLPLWPIPHPWLQDDFSFLLAARTFASGRLTNPTHPMWRHFESFHIDWHPTYMSMYFPGQGLVMAAGQVVFGHPWFGILISCGVMCAALCWALQGWLPSTWALLGGMLAGVRLALFSYFVNSYSGGAVCAIGGALVIGALPRLRRTCRTSDLFCLAVGLIILANTRPYEGLLVSIPALTFIAWDWAKNRQFPFAHIMRRTIGPSLLLLAATAFMGYYNHTLYGNMLTLPYTVNRVTYGTAPHFLFQPLKPEPVYRHAAMRNYYVGTGEGAEMPVYLAETRSPTGYLEALAGKALSAWFFYINFALLPFLFALRWAVRDRRIRFVLLVGLVACLGLAIETWFIPHYIAPMTVVIYLLLIQCMRHVRASGAYGLFLVRATPVLCIVLALMRAIPGPFQIRLPPPRESAKAWYGAGDIGTERAALASWLEHLPGKQLAVVRYAPDHLFPEWVYNEPDVDRSKVVWARDMDRESNQKLIAYFSGRTAWLIQPDHDPPLVSRYSETVQPAITEAAGIRSPSVSVNVSGGR